MNKNLIKSYAPQARRDFIQAVTDRAGKLGLTNDHIEPVQIQGDVATIGGQAFPRKVGELRQELERRINRKGFDQFVEAMAYTWFNRFVALRYMEIHDYLGHGWRVLSNRSGPDIPEILENATEVDLPGLDRDEVIELKLAGNRDNELYRMLIIAQCNALHRSMPFLFERIDDATELMLPDNLLHTDSPVQDLVRALPEVEWQDVEVIGWIYQFYMSEKKDQVIGNTVQPEDIPAATSLFTPNWIVRYMVHNTLGRMWLATYPESSIRDKMEFYIEPAQQEPEVQAELERITPKELDPEQITFLDPACGSGHILVEAYNLFKEIYLEQGYRTRDIPYYILQNNLFGLEIDDRSAQLAGFALLMKARQDNRRILEKNNIKLNVQAIQETNGLDVEYLARTLLRTRVRRLGPKQQRYLVTPREKQLYLEEKEKPEVSKDQLQEFLDLFRDAKTLGSLIQIPEKIWNSLAAFERLIETSKQGDIEQQKAAELLEPLVRQARMLGDKYDSVVANPPYMGARTQHTLLKNFLSQNYPLYKNDIFSSFLFRMLIFCEDLKYYSAVTPYVWLYISSFNSLRETIINYTSISSLIQLEYNAFEPACIPVCTFSGQLLKGINGIFIDLSQFKGTDKQPEKTKEAISDIECSFKYIRKISNFLKLPSSVFAFKMPSQVLFAYENSLLIQDLSDFPKGLHKTGNNDKYIRLWFEVSWEKIVKENKWIFYSKGGGYKKWYGNLWWIVDWSQEAFNFYRKNKTSSIFDENFYKCQGITYCALTSYYFSARYMPNIGVGDMGGPIFYPHNEKYIYALLAYLNSKPVQIILRDANPTLNYQMEDIKLFPLFDKFMDKLDDLYKYGKKAVEHSKILYKLYETSHNFRNNILSTEKNRIEDSYNDFYAVINFYLNDLHDVEEKIDRLVTKSFRLDEAYLNRHEDNYDQNNLISSQNYIITLISLAVGCMMGRYSLDEPGLIYAHEGNIGFDPSKYQTFLADDDGIIPIMDDSWFTDDTANRLEEFIATAWPKEYLEDNLKFIADSLGPKKNESPRETIRRYLSTNFFKDHMRMYKKRPIYWLFSSGKHKAFECLVYLHRYNEATLSRMRSEYVTPLMGKFSSRIEYLQNEIEAASTASVKNRLTKELNTLKKKQAELDRFDEELRHYSDQRISIDLDDGVKHNYGKFGNLLAEVKSITGKK